MKLSFGKRSVFGLVLAAIAAVFWNVRLAEVLKQSGSSNEPEA